MSPLDSTHFTLIKERKNGQLTYFNIFDRKLFQTETLEIILRKINRETQIKRKVKSLNCYEKLFINFKLGFHH